MFNIGAQSKVKESKHAQLGPVCHAFARKVLPQLNEEKTLFWRSRDHLRAILGVLISVWNLVKPSMFTTQCTSSFSSSCICAAQPATCCAHAMTSSCRLGEAAPRGNPGIFTPGVLPRSLLRGHFSCNQPTPRIHPRAFCQVAISLFRPPGKT